MDVIHAHRGVPIKARYHGTAHHPCSMSAKRGESTEDKLQIAHEFARGFKLNAQRLVREGKTQDANIFFMKWKAKEREADQLRAELNLEFQLESDTQQLEWTSRMTKLLQKTQKSRPNTKVIQKWAKSVEKVSEAQESRSSDMYSLHSDINEITANRTMSVPESTGRDDDFAKFLEDEQASVIDSLYAPAADNLKDTRPGNGGTKIPDNKPRKSSRLMNIDIE